MYNTDFIGNTSLSDLVTGAQNGMDRFSRSASNWLDVQLRTLEQNARFMPTGDRIRMIASGNFAHSLAKVVVSIPSAIAHPVNTLKAPFIAAAQGVDGALAINAIPARKYVPEQLVRLRNVTADDVARFGGKAGAALLPTRLLSSAKFAPELKLVDVERSPVLELFNRSGPGAPIDAQRFGRMKTAFERQGGEILQDDAYLAMRGGEGVTYNSKRMVLPEKPTTSAVFEEFIHTAQFRTGRASQYVDLYGNSRANTLLEIQAKEKLIINRRAYGIPNSETRQTIQSLREYRAFWGNGQ